MLVCEYFVTIVYDKIKFRHSLSLGEGRGKASTIQPYTFLAGRDYEGTPHGMYILSIGDGKVASIQVLDSGSFVYRGDSLLFTLYYRNSRGENCTYRPVFGGSLLPYTPTKDYER